jgi:hypothetical protein
MKQSRLASFLEQLGNTLSGFVIAMIVQTTIFPLIYGVPSTLKQDLAVVLVFTVASIARGYVWRRAMEALHVRRPLSPFMQAVIAERFRHVEEEGWSAEHDDRHERGELAGAGACYAHCAGVNADENRKPPSEWPWDDECWKPYGFRRDLVRGASLIIAEGDKFDRQRNRRGDRGAA